MNADDVLDQLKSMNRQGVSVGELRKITVPIIIEEDDEYDNVGPNIEYYREYDQYGMILDHISPKLDYEKSMQYENMRSKQTAVDNTVEYLDILISTASTQSKKYLTNIQVFLSSESCLTEKQANLIIRESVYQKIPTPDCLNHIRIVMNGESSPD